MGFIDQAPPVPAGQRPLINAKAPSSQFMMDANRMTDRMLRDLPTNYDHGPTPQAFNDYKGLSSLHQTRVNSEGGLCSPFQPPASLSFLRCSRKPPTR